MADAKQIPQDPLARHLKFPDATQIFEFAPVDLSEAMKDGLIAVDTNVLLIPYTTGQASLEQIRLTYQKLAQSNRLRIPSQVAREFADNRSEKLQNLYSQLSRKRNISVSSDAYRLLEGLDGYVRLAKMEKDIDGKLTEYRKILSELLDVVRSWHWDDPVSRIYREFFTSDVVIEFEFERDKLLADLAYRYENKIPPGYKDAGNEHSGVGDLLIWKTLLKIGETEQKHLIFVTGEEKSDWRHRAENQGLYPRFELVEEYRRASGGRSFLIISFANLLEQFGVPNEVISEVKEEESISGAEILGKSIDADSQLAPDFDDPRPTNEFEIGEAVFRWLRANYPDGVIERKNTGFPDFIVKEGSKVEGWEVKFLRRPSTSLYRRARELRMFVEMSSESLGFPINLLLVVDSIRYSDVLREYFGRKVDSTGFRVVIGMINRKGWFRPVSDFRK